MRRLPPMAAIRVFEAAARHANFTSAAEELGMTQAAVSYQIKGLEQRLGVGLFVRARGRVALSEAGRLIAGQVSGAFDALDEAFGRLREEDESLLRISTFNSFAAQWLAPKLGGFQLAHPGLAVRLDNSEDPVDFARDDIDVAVRGGFGDWPELRVEFLMRVLFAPMASPSFISQHGPLDTPGQIRASRLLSPDDTWWPRWFAGAGLSDPPPPSRGGIRLDSQPLEGAAAMAGQGVAILNPVFWRAELADGRLVQLGEAMLGNRGIWLVCPEHKRNAAKIKAFRQWIAHEVANDPDAATLTAPARSGPSVTLPK
ncbi:MAG: LysR family transcriptional regulator [Sphingomonadaceae bacterium]|nr:LysR family transcriptional regulator [Sphingomonadaceae bacterium]